MEPAASANAPMSMIKRIRITVHIVWTLALTSFVSSIRAQEAAILDLGINRLSDFTVPADMTNLIRLSVDFNQLTNLTLPANLNGFGGLDLEANRLSRLEFPAGLTSLSSLTLRGNQLIALSFPA